MINTILHYKKEIFKCHKCGVDVERKSAHHKFCINCAEEIYKERKKNYYDNIENYEHKKLQSRTSWKYRRYGITDTDYKRFLVLQDNKCSICGVNFDSIEKKHKCIDHDHVSGKVRGILCRKCNMHLGWIEKDSNRIDTLKNYLNRRP